MQGCSLDREVERKALGLAPAADDLLQQQPLRQLVRPAWQRLEPLRKREEERPWPSRLTVGVERLPIVGDEGLVVHEGYRKSLMLPAMGASIR